MAFKINNPLKHTGYKVDIQKGKVISEKEKKHDKFKTETEHEQFHDQYPTKPFINAEGKPFKMKGSPMKRNFGIGVESPIKQTVTPPPSYSGINIDPMSSYDYKASPNIPKFRDMVSLEQQQAYAKKVDERRAKRKEAREWEKTKEAGGGTLDELETKEKRKT